MMTEIKTTPFLKWPGGKRWLIPQIEELVKGLKFNRYFEPFLGGGSVFFSLNLEKSILSDTNSELINTYKVVQNNPELIISRIKSIPVDKDSYYSIRSQNPDCEIEKAIRFLFLNRVAFGGMYRVNKDGKFNVPYGGRTPNVLWEKELIKNASIKLEKAEIHCQDFEKTISMASKNDLVYCDPPYTVAHNLNGFRRYNENIFNWNDQIRLKESCEKAACKGVKIIISNAANISIKELYSDITPIELFRYSGLSTMPSKRKKVKEYLLLYNI